jgi:Tfp pilus assembly protein PilE
MKRLNQSGYTLVELAIAALILAALASTVIMARSFMAKTTEKNAEKAFATQKAVQMVEELRSLVNGGEGGVTILDNYGDGTQYNKMLTTDKSVTVASDPLSGNKAMGAGWKYWRQVEVTNVANDPFARIVTATVYKCSDTDPAKPGLLLAQTGAILRTITTVTPPSQVLDVYAIAISNTVGWFTLMPQMAPAFSQAVSDLENRNPGLDIRAHFITQSGFGRDFLYQPFINGTKNAETYAMPFVYFYPGEVEDTSLTPGNPDVFFSEPELKQDGNIQDDLGSQTLGTNYPTGNGYAVCDYYNHDLRYPDELAMYQAVSQYAVNNGQTPPEITLRMLLEQMNSQPQSFLNAILVSMHGEVLPLVALRNWSDPAKDPGNMLGQGLVANSGWPAGSNSMNMRVVTHPTLIHFPSESAGITLRAYAYYDGIDWSASGIVTTGAVTAVGITTLNQAYPLSGNNLCPVMSVYLPGVVLTAGNGAGQVSVSCIYGGVNKGVTYAYGVTLLPPGSPGETGDNAAMSWTVGSALGAGTTLLFYNTPLRAPEVFPPTPTPGADNGGLPVSCNLYESEYISCPVSSSTNLATLFSPDLTSTIPGPKNTARWIIMIHNSTTSPYFLPDGQYTVETRLGTNLSTGNYFTSSNTVLPDMSRTYVWMGGGPVSALGTASCGITPWTERYQYIGDPRDCPYADVKYGSVAIGTSDAYVTIPANSYNWYFKAITDGYSFGNTANGYDSYSDRRDMPKYYYLYRNAMLNQTALFCNLNGYTCWHADMGGEMGGTYDPFANSVSFIDTPWKPTDNTLQVVDEIQTSNDFQTDGNSSARDVARAVAGSNSFTLGSQWYARFWRGELYPDDWFNPGAPATGWLNYGNLPTGNGNFYRALYGKVGVSGGNSTDGFVYGGTYQWGVGGNACSAFINGIVPGTTDGFFHTTTNSGGGGEAALSALGFNLYNTVAFPLNSPVAYLRPWTWTNNYNSQGKPADWTTSSGTRVQLSLPYLDSPYTSATTVSRIFYDPVDQSGEPGWPQSPDTDWHGVGIIQMGYPSTGAATQSAFYLASGLAPQGDFGAYQLAETDLSAMIRSFMDGGLYHGSAHIVQLPLIQMNSGNPTNQFVNPSNITLSWGSPVTAGSYGSTVLWWRWAGGVNEANFYTEEFPGYSVPATYSGNTYSEDVTLAYVPMYSANQGVSWLYLDGSAAVTGTYPYGYPSNPLNAAASEAVTAMSVNWNVSSLVQSDYMTRVEAFRIGYPLHYSFHQLQISINR